MSDIFDHDEPHPEGCLFGSREELEPLTGQFEDGSGEVAGGAAGSGGSSEDISERESRFAISEATIDLFEALPLSFTLDEVFDRAERLGQSSAEAPATSAPSLPSG